MALDTGLISKHFLRRTARWRERSLEAEYPGNHYTIRRYKGRLYKWAVWRVR